MLLISYVVTFNWFDFLIVRFGYNTRSLVDLSAGDSVYRKNTREDHLVVVTIWCVAIKLSSFGQVFGFGKSNQIHGVHFCTVSTI